MHCFIHTLQNSIILASLYPKGSCFLDDERFFWLKEKKNRRRKKAPSLLYSPAVRFNVLPEAFSLLPILSLFLFPLTPFPVRRLYVSPSPHLPVESLRCIKAMLSARSCQAPSPLLAGIQLSGSDRRKRGRKSLTSHMVPSSAGASPLRGQMANSYISSTLLISSSEMENISLFALLQPTLGCGRLGAQLDSDHMLFCHVLKLLKMGECISVWGKELLCDFQDPLWFHGYLPCSARYHVRFLTTAECKSQNRLQCLKYGEKSRHIEDLIYPALESEASMCRLLTGCYFSQANPTRPVLSASTAWL